VNSLSSQTRVAKAAGILMIATIISRILGYVRDMIISFSFGQNNLTDAYNAAFSIPDFLYLIVVGGALSSAFIPVFSSYLSTDEEEEGWKVASTVFNLIVILMLVGIGIGVIFTPQLIKMLVPGFTPENIALTVKMTRIMFIQAFFMALTGITMGILYSYQNFLAPAVSSVVYNLGITIVGILLTPYFKITAYAIGVAAGGILQFIIQFSALSKRGLRYKPVLDLQHPGVRKIGSLMLPVLIGLSVNQFNLFINQNLGSNLPSGMISALRTAQRVMNLPVGIFAVTIAVASFPTLTNLAARQEKEEFKKTMSLSLRTILFVAIPSAVGLIALRAPVIRLLFQQGNFTAANTQTTAYALMFYCLGVFAYSSIQLLNRAFYALQDTRTPMFAGILTIAANYVLNILLLKPLQHGGLALAYSLAGIFSMSVLLAVLKHKLGRIGGRRILKSFLQTLVLSLLMGVIAHYTAELVELFIEPVNKPAQFIQVAAAMGAGLLVFMTLALRLKMEEAEMAKSILLRKFRRKRQQAD